MRMTKVFSITLSIFFIVWACSAIETYFTDLRKERLQTELVCATHPLFLAQSTAVQEKIKAIDLQIQDLEDMKRGFESRARRHDDQAQRLQFEDRAVLETRRHQELADENRAKARRVQEEIDRLQAKKQKLLGSTDLKA